MRALRNLGSALLQRRTPRRRPAVDNISKIDHPASIPVPVPPPSKNSISRQMMNIIIMQRKRKTMDCDLVSNAANYSTKAAMNCDWCHMHHPRPTPMGSQVSVDTKGWKKKPIFKKCVKFAVEDYNRKMCGKQQIEIELVQVTRAARLMGTIFSFEIDAIDKIDGKLKSFAGQVRVNGSFTLMGFKMVGMAD